MKWVWKIVKRLIFFVLALLGVLVIGTVLFLYLAPQIGAPPSGEHLEAISQSPNFKDGIFVNQIETKMDYSLGNMWSTIQEYQNTQNTTPASTLPTFYEAPLPKSQTESMLRVTWYGHSSFLLETDGKRLLLDPMLGKYASPLPIFGERFANDKELDLSMLTEIDAVLISHDHYDHLDYPSIQTLEPHVNHFYVPLGVGSHLKRWGVPAEKITEMDWWDSVEWEDYTFVAAPSRHFSGRGMGDNSKTQWASWVILHDELRLYFSGDSGYGPHFKEIGDKYGPFDVAMMECGQYNEKWHAIHMMPEQTVQASVDLNAKLAIPIHWGAFELAPHEWTDPIERFTITAKQKGVSYATPRIGEPWLFGTDAPKQEWWKI